MPGLVKLGIALGVLGLLGYDGFITVATHLKATNDAQNAAYAAASLLDRQPRRPHRDGRVWRRRHLPGRQQSQQITVCEGSTDPVCDTKGNFTVDPDGTVHLVVRREAKTLIFSHLGFMHSALIAFGTETRTRATELRPRKARGRGRTRAAVAVGVLISGRALS